MCDCVTLSAGDLTREHDGVQPLGGEVAAVRGPHVTEHRAAAEGEEEENRCFLHPLLDAINTVIITIQKTVPYKIQNVISCLLKPFLTTFI